VVYAAATVAAEWAQVYLWRVGVDGTRPPERLEIAGAGAAEPAIALTRDRLTFTHRSTDADIYRFEIGRPSQLVVGSTFMEMDPRFSPDGRRLVFGSARSGGTVDIWLAGADGSNLQQLTHGRAGHFQGSPSWSPDGRQIVRGRADLRAVDPRSQRTHSRATPSMVRLCYSNRRMPTRP
jgi:dipeptidyl aminopeptidase/acylaminoacyl peptidase